MALLEHDKGASPQVVGNSASFHDSDGADQLVYQLVRVCLSFPQIFSGKMDGENLCLLVLYFKSSHVICMFSMCLAIRLKRMGLLFLLRRMK